MARRHRGGPVVISNPHSDSLVWLRVTTLGRDDNQYVVTNPAGQELIRGSLTTDVLVIQGSDVLNNIQIIVDGRPIQTLGVETIRTV